MVKIAITGPESTGKTTLAKNLAKQYKTVWVPEYARNYLENTKGVYCQSDLHPILQGQLALEKEKEKKAVRFLFCDTDPLVIWVWSMVKYKQVDPRIEAILQHHTYDLYLLTYPDLPWENDPLRENENRLIAIFEIYLKKLKTLGYQYAIISGKDEMRKQKAVNELKRFD